MKRVLGVALAILVLAPTTGRPQDYPPTYREPNGRTWTCHAPHGATGQIVPVAGINGNAGGFWGFATYNAAGWPVIIFDVVQLQNLPLIVVRFTYYHECAHLVVPTKNEIKANCEGLINMRYNGDISPTEENILKQVHYSLPYLGPKYGGSGKVFWDKTMQCAGPP